MLVIPAINCPDRETALKQIKIASDFVHDNNGWIHIDIDKAHDNFAPSVSWGSPGELSELAHIYPHINFEVHLMFDHPEGVVEAWVRAGAKRVIVHIETISNPERIVNICKKYGADAMLACAPRTPVEWFKKYFGIFHNFQLLAVSPGPSAQTLDSSIIRKIKFLREYRSDAKIEIDGGIDSETAAQVRDAGADIIVSASYIFHGKSPWARYQKLAAI